MYGVFGGYTRWAVVFLIIFVLFFLFVPAYGVGVGPATGMAVSHYATAMDSPSMMGSGMMGHGMMGPGMMGYESPSS